MTLIRAVLWGGINRRRQINRMRVSGVEVAPSGLNLKIQTNENYEPDVDDVEGRNWLARIESGMDPEDDVFDHLADAPPEGVEVVFGCLVCRVLDFPMT